MSLFNQPASPSPAAPPPSVPVNFGAPNGTEISNKSTLLSSIDSSLGVDKSPALEFLFVKPFMLWESSLFKLIGFAGNYYGHAAVRYTLKSGESMVMNIEGGLTSQMVNFLPAEEYLFGTKHFDHGNSQGGIYNRNIISVRVENYPQEKIESMHRYYQILNSKEHAKFSLMFGNIWNVIGPWLPFQIAERGNCARWTSKGLVEAEMLRFPTLFPKKIWVNIFERYGLQDPSNVHVVSYRRVKHAHQSYGKPSDPLLSGVAPLHPITNLQYLDLERFADIIVEVPDGTTTAEIRKQENPKRASWWRHNIKNIMFCFFSGFVGWKLITKKITASATKTDRFKKTFT